MLSSLRAMQNAYVRDLPPTEFKEIQCAICVDFRHRTTVACPAIAMVRTLALNKEQVLSAVRCPGNS